jgi:hypothetical protein
VVKKGSFTFLLAEKAAAAALSEALSTADLENV